MATMAKKQLPSGASIPVVGLGVYLSKPGAETYDAVLTALKMGYRHIDTAQFYQNEADVGRAIADSGIPREDIFVTSKVSFFESWSYDGVTEVIQKSIDSIGGGYVDLYLIHAPCDSATRADAWRALEDAHAKGLLRDIGVSNFSEAHLKKLMETAKVKPAVNQIEMHPWLMRKELVKYCEDEGILIQAYSPLVRAQKMDDPVLVKIADEVKATPAQVLIAWSLAKGFITLPKSVKESRLKENLEASNVKLSSEMIAELDAQDCDEVISGWDPVKDHAV